MDVFDILDRLVAFPSVAGMPNGDITDWIEAYFGGTRGAGYGAAGAGRRPFQSFRDDRPCRCPGLYPLRPYGCRTRRRSSGPRPLSRCAAKQTGFMDGAPAT